MNNTTEYQPANEFKLERVTAAIEAILYAAGHPVEYSKLSEVLGLSQKDIKSMVEAMAIDYNREDSPRGVLLLTYPESCQFATKEEFLPYIREALGIKRGGNLSNSTMETLAVVAYNQPVTRAFVDAVRGVDSSYAMTSLVDKNLIESLSRLDAPGRPMLYTTTEKFLRVFGLSSLDDLPKTELSPTAISEDSLTVEDIGFSSALNVSAVTPGDNTAESEEKNSSAND
ncbi:MAG: SMC-Scp complex subunit ScpB [Ruminococcaceae bacterium]|nr:SMC-Scp complex subunit ScpB [Oscillospiraceae bacterium]